MACGGADRPGRGPTLLAIPLAGALWGARATRKHPSYWLGCP
jgi:hypothetical protein